MTTKAKHDQAVKETGEKIFKKTYDNYLTFPLELNLKDLGTEDTKIGTRARQEAIKTQQLEKTKEKAQEILKLGDPLKFLLDTVKKIHVKDDEVIALLIVSGCSSGFENRRQRININCVGKSGKGKSVAQEHTGLIFNKFDYSSSSSKTSIIYQADAGKLVDKGIIQLDEASLDEEMLRFERTLTDNREQPPVHKTVDTSRNYKKIEVNQINSIWRNSVDSPKDDQLLNRYITVNVDESPEQDEAVYNKQIEEYCFEDLANPKDDLNFITARHMTDIIKEKPEKIIIPFGNLIETTDKRNRRTLPKFLSLLRGIVYIYRFQRLRLRDYLLATKRDFELAQSIWNKAGELEGVQVTAKELTLLKLLPDNEQDAVGRNVPAKTLGVSIDTAKNYLDTLISKGIVNYKKLQGQNKYVYWTTKNYEELRFSISWKKFTVNSLKEAFEKLTTKTTNTHSINTKKIDYQKLYDKILSSDTVLPLCISSPNIIEDKVSETDVRSTSESLVVIDYIKTNTSENAVYLDEKYPELIKKLRKEGNIFENPRGTYKVL